jgi:hypothetical protein
MASTVTNKTRKPLSIPLGRGKKLFLGPGKSGEIASSAVESPAVKALVEEGAITIVEGHSHVGAGGSDTRGRPSHGYASNTGPRRSGDR